MNNRKMLSGLALLCAALLSQSAEAGSCERVRRCEPRHKHHYCHDKKHPFFVTVGAGASWSASDKVNVDHVTTNAQGATVPPNPNPGPATKFWDGAKEGYDRDHGTSEFYTVALGYHWSDYFSTNVELTHRPSYTYHKTQTVEANNVNPGNNNIIGLEALGNKTRHFELKETSLTFNIDLRTGGLFDWCRWQCGDNFTFQLILGGGVGIAYNRIENFHSVATAGAAGSTTGLARLTQVFNGRTPLLATATGAAHVAATAAQASGVGSDGATPPVMQVPGDTQVLTAVNLTPFQGDVVVFPRAAGVAAGTPVVTATAPAGFLQAHSIMLDRTKTDFVWQLKVGFEVAYKRCSFDIFYRYHDAGKFRTRNYTIDAPVNFLDPVVVPAWSGDMTAHELCFNMNKRF